MRWSRTDFEELKSEISQQKSEIERMKKIIEDQERRIAAQSTDIDVRVEAQVEARLAELKTQMLQSMDDRVLELIRMSGSGAPAVLPEDETDEEVGDGEDEGTFGTACTRSKAIRTVFEEMREKLKQQGHYTGKSLEDAIASIPVGVDSLDWQTMCEKWNTSDEQNIADRNKTNRSHQSMPYRKGRKSHYQLNDDFERMIQLSTPSLDSESGSTPISAEEAFVSVMGKDRSGRICCGGSRETLRL
ncbi:hypothetical protein Taro_053122, partial [Colocasia esculenta]|nr:hypothetical protein [Colocasia esculenta]